MQVMNQLRTLCFDVMVSSFLDGFHANVRNFLDLGCREDNGGSIDVWEFVTTRNLFINGRNSSNLQTAVWQTAKFPSL